MTPSQIIVLATPVFFLLIAIEYAWGIAKGRNTYRLADAINSIGLGMMSQFTAIFTRLLRVGIYTAVYSHLSVVPLELAREFWQTWYGWVLALLFYDLCYYWLHRLGHESAILWAAHAVHHQSQDYNLSTALRQTSSGALLGWVFYVPMAVAGVPPLVFGIVALIDLLYQFWVHTEHVPKLGWFDRWFCSPSNHRVHHAVNDPYLDKNYGGLLIIWDRIFGSFKEEGEKCVYGTRSPLNSWDPIWANFEVYKVLFTDARHASSWLDKVRVFLKPPGWRPADVAARFPKPAFDITQMRKFEAPVSKAAQWLGGFGFLAILQGVAVYLWFADKMDTSAQFTGLAGLMAALWVIGALLQGRIAPWLALASWVAVLATVSATFASLNVGTAVGAQWLMLHRLTKPMVMLIAIIYIAACAYSISHRAINDNENISKNGFFTGFTTNDGWLIAAMALSMLGDSLLMFNGFFIPGLVAFLLAHLCFIALFKRGMPWLPSRTALIATLGFGVCLYAYLFPSLDLVLRIAVAAYMIAIALMAAQAIGRASVLQNSPARWVAVGTCFFMLSDSLLAINRFASPLPLSSLWVLSSYFFAQLLIARNFQAARSQVLQTAK